MDEITLPILSRVEPYAPIKTDTMGFVQYPMLRRRNSDICEEIRLALGWIDRSLLLITLRQTDY